MPSNSAEEVILPACSGDSITPPPCYTSNAMPCPLSGSFLERVSHPAGFAVAIALFSCTALDIAPPLSYAPPPRFLLARVSVAMNPVS